MVPAMAETRNSLKARGRTGASSALRLPGRGSFPRVDDHLVEPEVTRDEIIGGRRVVAMPANPPHADRQSTVDRVVGSCVASGYTAAAELLTRVDEDSDFATDVCVRRDGVDPETGTRYLEEIAFEVVSEQDERDVTEKAQRMHRRGVRRIFAIFLKRPRVCEWSAESQSWRTLDRGAEIEDPCLVVPLPVAALLDAAAAAIAVVKGLAAQGNPELQRREDAARAAARAEDVLEILDARRVAVSEAQRREILGCRDLARLGRWLRRAALASSADEVTSEP
jgi:putative restriction endonuclease